MAGQDYQNQSNQVPYPNLPPLIDSRATEYRGTGITSSVAIFGHPIHPIIVIFPIAFLSGAAGADLGYWLTQDFFWARASIWLLGLGVLSAIAAAITGMADFINIPRARQRTAGWAHMALNVGALVLSIINVILRWGDPAGAILPVGLVLSLVVSGLLLASGWFGGELMFRHKVGIVGPGETMER
ncbi:hypothetical protein C7293_04705 [filamentous cyanobacterium CCT1]|nr:hypothetical protein C7293_04705 [filamentous cyanobacterium CCT1]PSN81208.1 hypothetical protein C8B47_02610 [filamentous cyanobacterium CCP4]